MRNLQDIDEELVVSPSRFSPLQDIDEEEEEDNKDEYGKETEEGEILESKEEGKNRQQTQASHRGKKIAAGSAHKPSRSKVIRAKDLLASTAVECLAMELMKKPDHT
ncbi:hypothetical protein YC2023_046293 [Brassica napus]